MKSSDSVAAEEIVRFAVRRETTLRETIVLIDANGTGIAIVVEPDGTLIDLVADGDVRRAILKGIDLAEPVHRVLEQKMSLGTRRPVTARIDDPPDFVLLLMERMVLHQIPLLDAEGRVRRVVHRDTLSAHPRVASGHAAVVMAGGIRYAAAAADGKHAETDAESGGPAHPGSFGSPIWCRPASNASP